MNTGRALAVAAAAIGVAAVIADRVLPAPDHPYRKPRPFPEPDAAYRRRAPGWDDERGPG